MKTVFVDLDNTLAANKTCENVKFFKGLYAGKKPIQIVINGIEYLYSQDSIIIISRYVGGWRGREEKIDWIKKYLPLCFRKASPFLISADDIRTKAHFIKEYAALNNIPLKNCIIIDDNKTILQECKKVGIKTLYPQQIICMYENIGGRNDNIK